MPDLFIDITGEDGSKQRVAPEHLGEAVKAGFKVDAADTDGLIPIANGDDRQRVSPENFRAAVDAGFRLDMPEPDPQPEPDAPQVGQLVSADKLPERPAEDPGMESRRTALDKARTYFEGAAQGATLGAKTPMQYAEGTSTWLGNKAFELMNPDARTVGFDESLASSQKEMAEREAANPYTHAGGQIYGAITSTLASGGGNLAARTMAATPTGLISRGAAKVAASAADDVAALGARRLAAWFGSKTAWKIASQATSLAVQGGLEGAAWGATHEVDQAAESGDWDGVAQRAWAGMKQGGQVGAIASLLVGGAFAAGKKGYEALERRGVTKAVGDWIDQLDTSPRAISAADDVSASPVQGEASGVRPTPSGVAGDVVDAADDTAFKPGLADIDPAKAQEARGPLVSSKIPDAQKRLKTLMRSAGGGVEETYSKATRAIRTDMDELLKAQDIIDERGGIAAKRAASKASNIDGARIGMQEFSPAISETRTGLQGLIDEFGEAALQPRGGLTAIKQVQSILKKNDQRISTKLASGELGDAYMIGDDIKRTIGTARKSSNPIVQDAMESEYAKWQRFLEDESIFGELAARQRAANPHWTERIRRSNDQRLQPFFVRSGEAADNPFEALKQSNDSTISSFIRRLGDDGNDGSEEALRRWLRASALDAQARANAWGTDALREQAAKVRDTANRIEDTLDAVAGARRGAQKWKNVTNAVQGIPFAESAVKLTGSAARKVSAIGGEDAIDRVAQATVQTRKAAVEVQDRLNAASAIKKLLSKHPEATRQAARQAVTLRAVEKRVAALDEQSDEERAMSNAVRAIGAEHPELADAIWRQNQMRREYLIQKLGPQPVDATGKPMARSKVELQQFKKHIEAVDDPVSAIERISTGEGTEEDVEVLQTLYPSMYDDFISKALDNVTENTPYKKRIRISQALGVPVDDTLDPGFIAAMQDSAQLGLADQETQKQKGAPNMGQGLNTRSDRISAR